MVIHVLIYIGIPKVSFLSRVNELKRLACSRFIGLHSSSDGALMRYAESIDSYPVAALKLFSSTFQGFRVRPSLLHQMDV